MRVFSIFDSELGSISVMNIASNIFFGIGIYFLPSLQELVLKDILNIPLTAIIIPIIFFTGGIVSLIVNYKSISKIKKEQISTF